MATDSYPQSHGSLAGLSGTDHHPQYSLWSAGLLGDRPPAGRGGRFYYGTDNGVTYYDTGAAWSAQFGLTASSVNKAGDTMTGNLTVSTGGITVTGNSTFNSNVWAKVDQTVSGTAATINTTTMRLGTTGALLQWPGVQGTHLADNIYFDGTNWRYLTTSTGRSTVTRLGGIGGIAYYTAPPGTADAVATLTQILYMDNTGAFNTYGITSINDNPLSLRQSSDTFHRLRYIAAGDIDAWNGNTTISFRTHGANTGPEVERAAVVTGGMTIPGDHRTIYGPNSTWGAYLSVGGNGQNSAGNRASIATTDGNIHLDAASTGGHGIYLAFYAGSNGTYFGNGASGQVGRVDSAGNASFSGAISGAGVYDNNRRIMQRTWSSGASNTVDVNMPYGPEINPAGNTLNSYFSTGWTNWTGNPTGNPYNDGRWFFMQTICHIYGAQWDRQIVWDMTGGTTYFYTRILTGGDATNPAAWTGWTYNG